MTEAILPIVLIVLVLVGIWAVVEVALTMRSARRDVSTLTSSAREVIEQAQPVVAKLDGLMDELEPAAKHVTPLLEKTEVAVSGATVSLDRVNGILEDVSSVSGAASTVTDAVKGVAESAATGVAGVMSRLRGGSSADEAAALPQTQQTAPESKPEPEAPTRYVDYGDITAPAAAQDEPAGKKDQEEA